MYKPAPKRAKKTNIVRTRTGCYTCRSRRTKCDETKPGCLACRRLGVECGGYTQRFEFRNTISTKDGAHIVFEREPLHTPPNAVAGTGSVSSSSKANSDTGCSPVSSNTTWSPQVENDMAPMSSMSSISPRTSFCPENNAHTKKMCGTSDIFHQNARIAASQAEGVDPMFKNHRSAISFNEILNPARYQASSATDHDSMMEDFYIRYWYMHVVELMSPVFGQLGAGMNDFPPLKGAILALSASSLGRKQLCCPPSLPEGPLFQMLLESSPKDHECRAIGYYGKAVSQLATEVEHNSQRIAARLCTSLLFSYFEQESGTFIGVSGHMHGIQELVRPNFGYLMTSDTGVSLLCEWFCLRSNHAMSRLPFGTGKFERALKDMGIQNKLEQLAEKEGTRYQAIIPILSESLRMNRIALTRWCLGPEHKIALGDYLTLDYQDGSVQKSSPPQLVKMASDDLEVDYVSALKILRKRLDRWHATLQEIELPFEQPSSDSMGTRLAVAHLKVAPLHFRSQEYAMNYLAYACAQMLSSEFIFDRRTIPNMRSWEEAQGIHPWETLILRIVAGVNALDCVSKNDYRCGVLSALQMCAILCPSVEIVTWIQLWTEDLAALGADRESDSPVDITLRWLRAIAEEKRSGGDFCLSFTSFSPDIEMSDARSKGELMPFSMIVHGKDPVTGASTKKVVGVP